MAKEYDMMISVPAGSLLVVHTLQTRYADEGVAQRESTYRIYSGPQDVSPENPFTEGETNPLWKDLRSPADYVVAPTLLVSGQAVELLIEGTDASPASIPFRRSTTITNVNGKANVFSREDVDG